MPFKGDLRVFSTTQLLNLINLAKKTGTLKLYQGVETDERLTLGDGETHIPKLERGEQRAEVMFKDGKLLFASTRDQKDDLTSVLQKTGKLNDEQARIIRERAKDYNDKRLALMLINANYVTKQNIVQSIQKHTVDVVFDMMAWSQELFEFEELKDGSSPVSSDRITVPIPLENVIIEGSRRIHDEKKLQEELPDLSFALKFREAPEKLKDIQLSTAEWRVVGFVNPKNSIRQIAKACNMTDTEIRRVVHALREAGLVELVKPPSPPKSRSGSLRDTKKKPGSPDRATIMSVIDKIKSL